VKINGKSAEMASDLLIRVVELTRLELVTPCLQIAVIG